MFFSAKAGESILFNDLFVVDNVLLSKLFPSGAELDECSSSRVSSSVHQRDQII